MGTEYGFELVGTFCERTNNYIYFGTYDWMNSLISHSDQETDCNLCIKMNYFFKTFCYNDEHKPFLQAAEEWCSVGTAFGVIKQDGSLDSSALVNSEKYQIIKLANSLMDISERYLFVFLLYDGFCQTLECKSFLDDNIEEFKQYLKYLRKKSRNSANIEIETNEQILDQMILNPDVLEYPAFEGFAVGIEELNDDISG